MHAFRLDPGDAGGMMQFTAETILQLAQTTVYGVVQFDSDETAIRHNI